MCLVADIIDLLMMEMKFFKLHSNPNGFYWGNQSEWPDAELKVAHIHPKVAQKVATVVLLEMYCFSRLPKN